MAGVVSRRYEKAGLRKLRFHDLRHTFGTHAIRTADSREVMEWMGHQDIHTTQLYLQFKPKHDAARRLSAAFEVEPRSQGLRGTKAYILAGVLGAAPCRAKEQRFPGGLLRTRSSSISGRDLREAPQS